MTDAARDTAPRPTRSEAEVTRECLPVLAMFGLPAKRRNVGGRRNAAGGYVAFGSPGDPDWEVELPPVPGVGRRTLYLEVKREGWEPSRARGKERARWLKQLAKLRAANLAGHVGLWTNDAMTLIEMLRVIVPGGRAELDAAGAVRLIPKVEGGATP